MVQRGGIAVEFLISGAGGGSMRLWTSGLVAMGTLLVGLAACAWGQTAAEPTAEEIAVRMLAKNAERMAALDHYDSERVYRVEYSGTGGEHKAEMKVRLEYKAPSEKHFVVESESGSKVHLRQGAEETGGQRAGGFGARGPHPNHAVSGDLQHARGGRRDCRWRSGVGAGGVSEGRGQVHVQGQSLGEPGRLRCDAGGGASRRRARHGSSARRGSSTGTSGRRAGSGCRGRMSRPAMSGSAARPG